MENGQIQSETNIGAMRKRRVKMADERRYLIYYTFGNEAAETNSAQNTSADLQETGAQNSAIEEGENV
jgi:hypothetical protein